MNTFRFEAGFLRELAEDEERPGARKCAALRVQEELGPVPLVEKRTAVREVAPEGIDRLPADRDDPLLRALADRADDPVLEIDARTLEADRLADAKSCSVEELDERAVAHGARRRASSGVDQPLRLPGRERLRQCPAPAREL